MLYLISIYQLSNAISLSQAAYAKGMDLWGQSYHTEVLTPTEWLLSRNEGSAPEADDFKGATHGGHACQ